MSLKKMLGIISIIIIVVFSMMLSTSYAWYAFDNASTTFSGVTNNDDVIISYQHGEYINTNIAIPITSDQIEQYSDKNNFNIRVKSSVEDNELVATISLVDISIAGALQDANFKIDLYYQGEKWGTLAGNKTSGITSYSFDAVVLDNDVTNNFEVRVYLLDNDDDQTALMNKTFSAKLQVDIVSRLKVNETDYSGADILVSSIMIDGQKSNSLPTSGYYDMTATCTKGSNLTWEPLSKTITYAAGSYINDSCSLVFTSSTDYPLLSEMPVGSYVKYVGSNGCDGKACEGYNANYVNDIYMGYCYQNQFFVNGWRIAYVDDNGDSDDSNDNALIVSAGAPECVGTYIEDISSSSSNQTLSSNYYYGSGYKFDENTGNYILTGNTVQVTWSDDTYESIIENTPYTCMKTSLTENCTKLYEVYDYSSQTVGVANLYESSYTDADVHIAKLNDISLKYCNKNYAKGGVCDSNTSRAMNANDFEMIVNSEIESCGTCARRNDLIDNGSWYWLASNTTPILVYNWNVRSGYFAGAASNLIRGVRPILSIASSVIVTGGSGTYDDPYIISNGGD